jgi:hypothetical protein
VFVPAGWGSGREGRVQCLLQAGWIPYVTSVLLIAVGVHLAGVLAFSVLPRTWRRARAGERIRVRHPGAAPPSATPVTASAQLAAAAWAQTDPRSGDARALAALGWARSAGRRHPAVASTPRAAHSGRVVDGRPIPSERQGADEKRVEPSAPPAARCLDCSSVWHSTLLVDGLRLIGTCPRCGSGTLEFRDAAPTAADADASEPVSPGADRAAAGPHLVMGVPRR